MSKTFQSNGQMEHNCSLHGIIIGRGLAEIFFFFCQLFSDLVCTQCFSHKISFCCFLCCVVLEWHCVVCFYEVAFTLCHLLWGVGGCNQSKHPQSIVATLCTSCVSCNYGLNKTFTTQLQAAPTKVTRIYDATPVQHSCNTVCVVAHSPYLLLTIELLLISLLTL